MPIYTYNPQTSTGDYVTYSVFNTSSSSVVGQLNILKSDIVYISGKSPLEGYFSNIHPDNSSSSSSRIDSTGVSARFYLDTYNNTNDFGSSFRGRRFRGTANNPSGVLKNDVLLQLVGDGYNQQGVANRKASLFFISEENWTTGANGTYIILKNTPAGTTEDFERLRINSNGNVGISNFNPQYKLDVSGAANFTQGIYLNNEPIQSLLTGATVTPQNSEIYRNPSNQITGIKYNNDFSRIYRNINDKITGIYYNNYFKKILYDGNGAVTGVNVIYY